MKGELACWPFLQDPKDIDEVEGFSLQETVGHLTHNYSLTPYNVNSLTHKGDKWKNGWPYDFNRGAGAR